LALEFAFGGRQAQDANVVAAMLANWARRLPLIEIVVPG